MKIGLIPANRGFFSDELAVKMRNATVLAMEKVGLEVIVPDSSLTKLGCVETLEEAQKTGRLFRDEDVQGIIVAAVNFGDEQAVAFTIKEARLNVPVLIFGCQEEEVLKPTTARRDSFCGLLSIGEALRQIGVKYTVARVPICYPSDKSFEEDLRWFAGVCRVVNGIRNARYGQIGSRPDAFWTCRADEKALQRLGVTTVDIDLSEAIVAVSKMDPSLPEVRKTEESIRSQCEVSGIPESALNKIARFEVYLRQVVAERKLDALAIQCWTNLQEKLGICACSTMGRLGDEGIPCACESDVLGALSMHALTLASGGAPSALADWNNLHNEDPELVNVWHCGVFPPSFAKSKPKMGIQSIIAGTVGSDNAWGLYEFEVEEGPITLFRVTQDPDDGWKAVVVPATIESTNAKTFGAYGWARIKGLQNLYRDVLARHFPHHVAMIRGEVQDIIWEAFGNYLGFQMYAPNQLVPGKWSPMLPF
jgi:L-fucose isomerase-like protein